MDARRDTPADVSIESSADSPSDFPSDAPADRPFTGDAFDGGTDDGAVDDAPSCPPRDAAPSDGKDASPDLTSAPVCGNGIVELYEGCEPPLQGSCNSICQIAGKCDACKIMVAGASCNNFTGDAQRNCDKLQDCLVRPCATAFAASLTSAGVDPMRCFCDVADATTCMSGNGLGVCRAEFEAAAGTKDAAKIIAAFTDKSTPVGTAVALARGGASDLCTVPNPGPGCPFQTVSPPTCGNGRLDTGEQCDPPQGSTCDTTCQLIAAPDGGAPPGGCSNVSPEMIWTAEPLQAASLWTFGPKDAWALTNLQGRLPCQHWDGASWSKMVPPWGTGELPAAGSGPNDLWFPGKTLRHWDGSTLKTMIGFPISQVWQMGPNAVWAAPTPYVSYSTGPGVSTRRFRWNGTAWSEHSQPVVPNTVSFYPPFVWGASIDDVWEFVAAWPGWSNCCTSSYDNGGQFTIVRHWDGQTWTMPSVDPVLQSTQPAALWGSSANDIWYAGTDIHSAAGLTDLWHYDGRSWTLARKLFGAAGGITGTSSTDVYLWLTSGEPENGSALLHFDGAGWSPVPVAAGWVSATMTIAGNGGATSIAGIRFVADPSGDLWAAGVQGGLATTATSALFHRHHACADGAPDAGASPSSEFAPRIDGGFNWTVGRAGAGGYKVGVVPWAVAPSDVWRSTEYGVDHWDGQSWSRVLLSSDGGRIWASGPKDVWVIRCRVQHWDGKVWTDRTPGTPHPGICVPNYDVWGFAPNDVWVIGQNFDDLSTISYHWDGCAWTTRPFPQALFPGHGTSWPFLASRIWGAKSTDVWAFGGVMDKTKGGFWGGLMHWDGTSWSPPPDWADAGFNGQELIAAWGSAANDVWALSFGIFSSGPTSSYMFWHYDGSTWTQRFTQPAPTGSTTSGSMWGTGPNDVWAAAGHILWHYDGVTATFLDDDARNLGDVALYSGGTSPKRGEVWVGGSYASRGGFVFHGLAK